MQSLRRLDASPFNEGIITHFILYPIPFRSRIYDGIILTIVVDMGSSNVLSSVDNECTS